MSELTNIKKPNIFIRVLALISDAAIFLFITFMLMGWVFTPIAEKAFSYSEIGAKEFNYQLCSGLFVVEVEEDDEKLVLDASNYKTNYKADNTVTPLQDYETDDLDFYKNRLKYYYCSFRTNTNLEYDTGSPEPNLIVVGEDSNEYSPQEYFDNFISSLTDKDEILNCANDALLDFFYSSYYQELDLAMKRIQIFIFLPSIFVSYGIFYILIPLLFKNGETLGKKILSLAFVDKNGYQIKKRQIIFRQLLLFIYLLLFAFIFGVGFTSFATLGVGVFIYLLFTLVNKENRSFLDLLAMTRVVDARTSTWYRNAQDVEDREKELEKKMKIYNSRKPKNNNVIQVGSKIIKKK